MKISLVQTLLFWENRKKNLEHFDKLIDKISESTDVIVLPEMFTTGFSMKPEKTAEPWNGEALAWMKDKAGEKKCVVTGSVAVEESGKYYNRLFWVNPDGSFNQYDKRHLFRMGHEDEFYSPGTRKIITKVDNWKICPMICYDLRFPVWSRNRFTGKNGKGGGEWDYDVLIYVANWPEARNYPWKQLLIARAIENQCYVIGVNRIGTDGNGVSHSGDSVVINPRGELMSKTKAGEESVETVELDKNYLEEFRKIFPVGLDADGFEIK